MVGEDWQFQNEAGTRHLNSRNKWGGKRKIGFKFLGKLSVSNSWLVIYEILLYNVLTSSAALASSPAASNEAAVSGPLLLTAFVAFATCEIWEIERKRV